ncbi:MAG: hypothetical protein M1469_07000 [Bacteroidetes bacterium]|nr:hypothetical protein [Bacteroidota bacterium]
MKITFLLSVLCVFAGANAQSLKETYKLDGQPSQPSSNTVNQILITNGAVYLATNKGLNITTDGGSTFQKDFGTNGPTGVSTNAIAVKGDTIVTAVSTTFEQNGTSYPKGTGLYVSTDNGATWTHEPQSLDSLSDSTVTFGHNVLKALPITTEINNITYSLAFYGGYLYAANFAGGVRRSSDLGKTWHRVVLPPDYLNYINADSTYSFQLSPIAGNITTETNYNHEAFALYADGDSALYVGTADGVDKTTDNGFSWYKFNHQNEGSPMSGDFVVSINVQNYGGVHNIWAATVNANDPTEVPALSYTSDGGASWHYILRGHFFHSMAFQDSIVYGASDDGLFRTSDLGQTSEVMTNVLDPATNQQILSPAFYAVATEGDSVWVGSGDGTAIGIDNGGGFQLSQWNVLRTYVSVGNQNLTYFYPNPFSPRLDIGRIHYSVPAANSTVTIRIYDFSMHVIRTLLQNAPRNAGENDDTWNGLDDSGRMVDNGVYFYSVSVNNGNPLWGKILVVR